MSWGQPVPNDSTTERHHRRLLADAINALQRLLGRLRVRAAWYFQGPLDDHDPLMVWTPDFNGKFMPLEWAATAEVAAATDTTINVNLTGVLMVTVFFAAGSHTGVVTEVGPTEFTTADKIIVPPLVTPDADLADVAITVVAKYTRL